jgi:phosphoglycolate phosphatase-like HAD superfamily hydrolase
VRANVIFDLDGTLVRTAVVEAWWPILSELGMSVRQAEQFVNATQGQAVAASLRALHLAEARIAMYERRFWDEFVRHPADRIEHADELLARLHADGCRLYLSTGSNPEVAQDVLEQHGWTDRFRLALGSSPDDPKGPSHYRQFIADSGLEDREFARRTATVGDGVYDMRFGREHGVALRVGFVEGSQDACDRLVAAGANVLIDELAELQPLLHLL